MTSVLEALKSAQFVVNADGQKVAVQLSPTLWQALLNWMETAESIPSLEALLAITETDSPQDSTASSSRGATLANIGTWAGGDFEDSLQTVYDTRSQTRT